MRQPDFSNLLKVLHREVPERPTLFEFFLNDPLCRLLADTTEEAPWQSLEWCKMNIKAFAKAGYDYTTILGTQIGFKTQQVENKASRSMNETAIISDRADFETYEWPEPDEADYSRLDSLRADLPDGMKLIVYGPGGVLENVMALVGYEKLCYLIIDDPDLAKDIFDAVGSRLARYYQICSQPDTVGALISNDDWGFSTQTMLSPSDMRKYVIPWHKAIVEAIHAAGKPAILHSCGKLDAVMDDIIDIIGYDAKHSYEDKILPVEEAYEKWGRRIAVLGGLDLDFVCRANPDEVKSRACSMLERSAERGGYALGTGNSVPEYVPWENYFAMISAVNPVNLPR